MRADPSGDRLLAFDDHLLMADLFDQSTFCPLCASRSPSYFHRDRLRDYLRCDQCHLVFVPPTAFLSRDAEQAYYTLHQNDPDDPGYRRFLSRLALPLMQRLAPGARGLDFGCGPGPTLSLMLDEAGFPTRIFDPIYAPDDRVWDNSYDFVTASEVVEHLHRPMAEFERIWKVLKPGGWFGIMTKRVLNRSAFATWHYKTDPTHVVFFSEATFVWLAQYFSARLTLIGADVALLQKPESPRISLPREPW